MSTCYHIVANILAVQTDRHLFYLLSIATGMSTILRPTKTDNLILKIKNKESLNSIQRSISVNVSNDFSSDSFLKSFSAVNLRKIIN